MFISFSFFLQGCQYYIVFDNVLISQIVTFMFVLLTGIYGKVTFKMNAYVTYKKFLYCIGLNVLWNLKGSLRVITKDDFFVGLILSYEKEWA